MDRPYIDTTIDQLEQLVADHKDNRVILAKIDEELGFRTTARPRRLHREVTALLDGELPVRPKRRKREGPESQLTLDDEVGRG